ncbi:MAG: hypothetical protein WA977_08580 [Halobacteriota archaeon]
MAGTAIAVMTLSIANSRGLSGAAVPLIQVGAGGGGRAGLG